MKWPETWLLTGAFYTTWIVKELINKHQEPIEGIKVWILLGYPSNVLGYKSNVLWYQVIYLGIQVNTEITLPRRN